MRAIKLRIYPNQTQRELIEKHFGCCRWMYNYALERKIKHYNETGKTLHIYEIGKDVKTLRIENEWLREINCQSLHQVLKNLDSAFSHFFRKTAKFPRFRSKKNTKQSFGVPQGFVVNNTTRKIKLPKLGWIRFRHKFDFTTQYELRQVTVSRNSANEYYASVLYIDHGIQEPEPKPILAETTVGIDLGVRNFATMSDGTVVENPRHFKQHQDRLAAAQQRLSKMNHGSNNYKRQKLHVAKIHRKVANSRLDFLHKVTTNIADNQSYDSVAIEDLNTKDLLEKSYRNLARSIADCGWCLFRQLLAYKLAMRGKNLLVIGRFEPSSKTCTCGYHNESLTLDQTEWTCPQCGVTHNRDVLASNNIKTFATVGHTVPKGVS